MHCPNCGSYVSPGSTACSCGTTFKAPKEEKVEEPYDKYSRKAYESTRRGDYTKALEYWDQVLDIHADSRAKKGKADTCYKAGMYEEAIDLYRQCLSRGLYLPDAYTYSDIGRCLISLERFSEALEEFQNALDVIYEYFNRREDRDEPDTVESKNERISDVYLDIAILYRKWALLEMDSEDYCMNALKNINLSIEFHETEKNWNIRGLILEMLERYDEAERSYDHSLAIKKNRTVIKNKARMSKDWAWKLYNAGEDLKTAEKIVSESIFELSDMDGEEDLKEYTLLLDLILKEKRHMRDFEILNMLGKENLVTIETDFDKFYKDAPLKFVKVPPFKTEEIEVYFKDKKIGRVSNSLERRSIMTSSADDLKKFPEVFYGVYAMKFEDEFHIANLSKKRFVRIKHNI